MRARTAAIALLLLPLAPAVSSVSHAGPGDRRTIRRHFTPADRERGRYQYIPVDVQPGVTQLTITYRYTDDGGASGIDLGLFQPGPLTIGTPAFRGYSGGATRTVTLAGDRATPGYIPGPIPAGTWHVLLGLYRVAPAGVDVEIDVDSSTPPAIVAPKSTRSSHSVVATKTLVPRGPRWFSGGLHLHTLHSDGTVGPNALAASARAAGLDFIVITDHNNTTHTLEPVDSETPLRIVGEEITTPAGHANAWGLHGGAWIDFRVTPGDPDAARLVSDLARATHRAGALFSINHPVGDCAGCAWMQAIPDELDGIEIWNGRMGPQDGAIALWDRLLRAGRHVTAVGASDWHHDPDPIGAAAVRVLAPGLTEPDLLDAIHRGHVIVMRRATDEPPDVSARCRSQKAVVGDTMTCATNDPATLDVGLAGAANARADLVWNGSRIASKTLERTVTFPLPLERGYARVQLYAADGTTIAVTNPIHVDRR